MDQEIGYQGNINAFKAIDETIPWYHINNTDMRAGIANCIEGNTNTLNKVDSTLHFLSLNNSPLNGLQL